MSSLPSRPCCFLGWYPRSTTCRVLPFAVQPRGGSRDAAHCVHADHPLRIAALFHHTLPCSSEGCEQGTDLRTRTRATPSSADRNLSQHPHVHTFHCPQHAQRTKRDSEAQGYLRHAERKTRRKQELMRGRDTQDASAMESLIQAISPFLRPIAKLFLTSLGTAAASAARWQLQRIS